MKKYILFAFLFSNISLIMAQKVHHSFYLGPSLTSTGVDLTNASLNYKNYSEFKNTQLGFDIGYLFNIHIIKPFSLGIGAEYSNITSKFSRPHVENGPFIDPRPVYENIKFSRIKIPVKTYYTLVDKKQYSFYATASVEFIIFNKGKRKVVQQNMLI
jgi:Outer membrane protein beta-barrel domain